MKDLAERLSLVHRVLGLALAAFLGFHVWQVSAAAEGRFAFVDRLDATALPLALSYALLLPVLFGHAVLGVRSAGAVRRKEAGTYDTAAVRGLQLAAGVLVLVFVVAHLVHVWRPRLFGATAIDLYERLREDLPRPAFALFYLGGVTAACAHLGLGVVAGLRARGLFQGSRAVVLERSAGAIVALFLFVGFVNVLAHFVAGQGLFGATPSVDVVEGAP